ncbi:MAG: DUF58 domain-containing protein [Candidatus Brocadiaceae bacterium]|nr:DUF58 domain-containing protein [Candidatus Brocadiaceae bacterium]
MKKRIRLYLQRLIGNRFEGVFSSYLNAPHGLEFDELRQYQPGDDFRSIDWKATARTGNLHVRINLIDKRVVILFLIDTSRSEKFGSSLITKEQAQSKIMSLLVSAASETGNEIGFITFTDRVENYIRPKAGEKEALKNIKDILLDLPSSKCTDLNTAFTFLCKKSLAPALVFILSDFLAPYNYEQSLKTLSCLHEVVPIIVSDRREANLPNIRGFLTVKDMETHETRIIDISAINKQLPCFTLFRKLELDYLALSTEESEEGWVIKISEFFDKRVRRGGKKKR